MKYILTLLLTLPFISISQSVTIDGGFIRMTGDSRIIIVNGGPDAFSVTSNGGGIIMEDENSVVQWNDVNSIGTYMIPFASSSGDTIPFTYEISDVGVGGDNITFNSHEVAPDNFPMPTGVLHITDDFGTDNGPSVIDRYWIITPNGYTTKPRGTYTFTYDDNDWNDPTNFINEANLTAQRYNSDEDKWLDWLYGPTTNTITNQLTITIANQLDQYSVWTLSDINNPLPIELVRFTVDCESSVVTWVTVTETNTSHYIIQGSDDAYEWNDIRTVEAAGNSNQILKYSEKVDPYGYYRLHQFDVDGSNKYSDILYGCPDFESINVIVFPNPNDGRFFINHPGIYNIEIYDMVGKLIFSEKTDQRFYDMTHLPNGRYVVNIHNEINIHTFNMIKID